MGYPNVAKLVAEWLDDNLDTPGVQLETDPNLPVARQNLAYALPLIHVVRLTGGGDAQPTLDRALLEVTSYAATHDQAVDVAGDAHYQLRYVLAKQTLDGAFIERVGTNQPPASSPYDNAAIRRVSAVYEMHVHFDPSPSGS